MPTKLKAFIEFPITASAGMGKPQAFPVPASARELKITHGVFFIHSLRGPMCFGWQKEGQSNDERLATLSNAYGKSATNITFISIAEEAA